MVFRLRRHCLALLILATHVTPTSTQAQSPTVRTSCALVQDTLIRQRTPTQSYSTYPKGWAHSAVEGIPGSWIEALLHFDLSRCLPANARVSAARLTLHVTNASKYPFEIYQLLRPFTATANWNTPSRGAGAVWTRAGAMGSGTDYGARVGRITSAGTGPLTVSLSASVVQKWVGAASASIVVRPTGTPGTNFAPVGLGFRSKEHRNGAPPALEIVYSTPAPSFPSTFKIVTWNLHYGRGMTAKAPGVTCPFENLKDNAQCQIADNPATSINEREEERRRSAWGVGLTQHYLDRFVLNDPEVIALLLTEVNDGTCITQAGLMSIVRRVWPGATISRSHRDNWIVARWGFAAGGTSYAQADLPPCGFKDLRSDGTLVTWPAVYREGIQWARIYAEDPDPDRDGALTPSRTLNVFNAHWPHRGIRSDGTPFFCMTTATITRDFMAAPAPGINLAGEPVILGGDLNTEDLIRAHDNDCEPIGGRNAFAVLRQAGFADAFTSSSTPPVTPTLDGASGMVGKASIETCYRSYSHNGLYMPYKRIDYQWFKGGATAGGNLRAVTFELIGVEEFGNCVPSDHMGTKVQYQWY